jgi:hypothetical protein
MHADVRELVVRVLYLGLAGSGSATLFAAGCASTNSENGTPAEHVATVRQSLFVPSQCDSLCQAAVSTVSQKYNLPRWFLYTIIARESSFQHCTVNTSSSPFGYGPTQLTGVWYYGTPYPQDRTTADDTVQAWRDNMGLGAFTSTRPITGTNGQPYWISMQYVSTLNSRIEPCANGNGDVYDWTANVERFASGYAAAAYSASFSHATTCNPNDAGCAAENLRKVAYFWNHGIWYDTPAPTGQGHTYPNYPDPYLDGQFGYDYWAYGLYGNPNPGFRQSVENDDGPWYGPPCQPPYSNSGCTGGGTNPSWSADLVSAPSCINFATTSTAAITATYTNNGAAASAITDIEVWQGSTKAGQGYPGSPGTAQPTSFGANQTIQFSWTWTLPPGAVGTYNIDLGVFTPNWESNPLWKPNVGTIAVSSDSSKYNYECGLTHAMWCNDGGAVTCTGLVSSTDQASVGLRSLKVPFTSNAATTDVRGTASNGSPVPSSVPFTITAKVFIPSSTTVTQVQLYYKDQNWTYRGGWVSVTPGAWNSLSRPSVTGTTSVQEVGIGFNKNAGATAAAYVDAITW